MFLFVKFDVSGGVGRVSVRALRLGLTSALLQFWKQCVCLG